MPFDREARRRVFLLAAGVPRRINLLCDRALLGAYALGRRRIDRSLVEQAAREVMGEEVQPPRGFERLSRLGESRRGGATRARMGGGPRFGLQMALAAGLAVALIAAMTLWHRGAPVSVGEPPAAAASSRAPG